MVARYDKVLLRKVDIVNWESDAWKQVEGEYKVRGIPTIAVFDGKGNYQGTVPGHPPLIEDAIRKALAQ